MLSFAYLAFVSLLKLLLRGRRYERAQDIELIALRHQREGLRRHVERLRLRTAQAAFIAAASRLLAPLLRALLHRARESTCTFRRLYAQSERWLGRAAGAQLRLQPTARRRAIPDSRPRLEVQRRLRRGLPQRSHQSDPHPAAGS